MTKTQQVRVGQLLKLLNRPALSDEGDIREKVQDFIALFDLI